MSGSVSGWAHGVSPAAAGVRVVQQRVTDGLAEQMACGAPFAPAGGPVVSGRCGVLTRRRPVIRVAQWQDSDLPTRAAGRSAAAG